MPIQQYHPDNERPMLPRCCACGNDVLACLGGALVDGTRWGPAHSSAEAATNKARLTRYHKARRIWDRTKAGRAWANRP